MLSQMPFSAISRADASSIRKGVFDTAGSTRGNPAAGIAAGVNACAVTSVPQFWAASTAAQEFLRGERGDVVRAVG